ncbi:hypothetical protein EYR36_002316 [Pleurotus pulmonarius]|nr:hypothetical protein EYR36_002316 [Pleurotus pulmonarius]
MHDTAVQRRRLLRIPSFSFRVRRDTHSLSSSRPTRASARPSYSSSRAGDTETSTQFTDPHNELLSNMLQFLESSSQSGSSRPTTEHSRDCHCCRRALIYQADGHRLKLDQQRRLHLLAAELRWAHQQVLHICDSLRSTPLTAHLATQANSIEDDFLDEVRARMDACIEIMDVEITVALPTTY